MAELPVERMIGEAVVLDLTFRGHANGRITPENLNRAERSLNAQGHRIEPGGTILLRTDWPKGHVSTDPKWWDESPCLTRQAAEWLVAKQPAVLGYDFAQEEKGGDYEHAGEILGQPGRVEVRPPALVGVGGELEVIALMGHANSDEADPAPAVEPGMEEAKPGQLRSGPEQADPRFLIVGRQAGP